MTNYGSLENDIMGLLQRLVERFTDLKWMLNVLSSNEPGHERVLYSATTCQGCLQESFMALQQEFKTFQKVGIQWTEGCIEKYTDIQIFP
jgi:hypothetical protein